MSANSAHATIPLSAYVHLPWCVRKCPYCDFKSHAADGELPETAYVAALARDIAIQGQQFERRRLQTVFFGGGTPSLFSPHAIGQILAALDRAFGIAANAEITLEANPSASDADRFAGYRAAGVNRLSIGAQSFAADHLQALGRIHTTADIDAAVNAAQGAGFTNINLDLMHGLPGQSVTAALADLQHAISLGPTHISWYQLTIEPNTAFYSSPPLLPADDTLADIEEAGFEFLINAGFERYEVSAFARDQMTARHNLNYWEFGDYLGVGAGAHGKHTARSASILRTRNSRLPADYMRDPRPRISEAEERFFEFMLNALRLTNGFTRTLYVERTGDTGPTLDNFVRAAEARTLVQEVAPAAGEGQAWQPSELGLRFLNDLQMLAAEHDPAQTQIP